MTARRVAALLAAGLALVAFAMWIASQRHLERATLAGDLVLPDLEHHVNTVTEIGLRKGDGARTTLKKDSAGWSVGERGWPADPGKVRKLLLDLWALIVGKSSSAKSGYVRVANVSQSLLAAPLLTVDADPKGWLDRALIDLAPERVRQVEERPTEGAAFSATRDRKEQTDFTVMPVPKGRELTGPGAADPISGSLSSLTFDDVGKAGTAANHKAAHALFRTFDGLEVDVAGRKDGTRSLVTLSTHASAKQTQAEAQRRNARLGGWEFEIPDYKYAAIFRPLEDLLKKPPERVRKTTEATAPGKAPDNASPPDTPK